VDNLESVGMIDINMAFQKIIHEKQKYGLKREEFTLDVVAHSLGCRAMLLNMF